MIHRTLRAANAQTCQSFKMRRKRHNTSCCHPQAAPATRPISLPAPSCWRAWTCSTARSCTRPLSWCGSRRRTPVWAHIGSKIKAVQLEHQNSGLRKRRVRRGVIVDTQVVAPACCVTLAPAPATARLCRGISARAMLVSVHQDPGSLSCPGVAPTAPVMGFPSLCAGRPRAQRSAVPQRRGQRVGHVHRPGRQRRCLSPGGAGNSKSAPTTLQVLQIPPSRDLEIVVTLTS